MYENSEEKYGIGEDIHVGNILTLVFELLESTIRQEETVLPLIILKNLSKMLGRSKLMPKFL